MPVTLAFWAMTIASRELVEITPPVDLHITNASLGIDLADAGSRTCLDLYYDDSSEEEVVGQDGAEPGKSDKAKGKTKAKQSRPDVVLCSLTPGKIEQALLDIVLTAGENYAFYVHGANAVMLAGNYIDQDISDIQDEVHLHELQLSNDVPLVEHEAGEEVKDKNLERRGKLQEEARSPRPQGKRDRNSDEEEPQNARKKPKPNVSPNGPIMRSRGLAAQERQREQPAKEKLREGLKRSDTKGKQPERPGRLKHRVPYEAPLAEGHKKRPMKMPGALE